MGGAFRFTNFAFLLNYCSVLDACDRDMQSLLHLEASLPFPRATIIISCVCLTKCQTRLKVGPTCSDVAFPCIKNESLHYVLTFCFILSDACTYQYVVSSLPVLHFTTAVLSCVLYCTAICLKLISPCNSMVVQQNSSAGYLTDATPALLPTSDWMSLFYEPVEH